MSELTDKYGIDWPRLTPAQRAAHRKERLESPPNPENVVRFARAVGLTKKGLPSEREKAEVPHKHPPDQPAD